MAKVWFVRRRGGQWVAPGGTPAFEVPLSEILYPLDLGTHRRLDGADAPRAAPELAAEAPQSLQRVFVEIFAEDVKDRALSGYWPGIYDSALSPGAES